METQKRNINIPVLGFKLIQKNMNPRTSKAIIRAVDEGGTITLAEKEGYLVDMIMFLEEMGVDQMEMQYAVEQMAANDHDTANFGTLGTFIFSAYEGLKQ